ncbi:MAG: hypothetical protein QG578_236 [Thermodesulfobacteriota bacterium]|nr:hypothetical protein [Thermodesulfobacteriota bacterium]
MKREYMNIDGSPVPGITLKFVLRGHTDIINRIAWSPDGQKLASPSADLNVHIWDVASGECLTVLKDHGNSVNSVAWAPDGQWLASGSGDDTIQIWNTNTWRKPIVLNEHTQPIWSVAWSPDGQKLASGSYDETIKIWDTKTWKILKEIEWNKKTVSSVAWSPDGQKLAAAFDDKSVCIWNPLNGTTEWVLEGHSNRVNDLVWAPNQPILASCSSDNTIRLWDIQSGQPTQVLEGHTGEIKGLSFSSNGYLLASRSSDMTVRLWRTDTWETVTVINEKADKSRLNSPSFHPFLSRLATLGENEKVIRIWDIEIDMLLGRKAAADFVRYTNAKVLLVGDSGVGKTGLAYRLTENCFKESISTDGAWATQLILPHTYDQAGIEREIWLWDFAGQADYRLIHQLYMDETALAVLVFNPQNENPFEGLGQWDRDLRNAARRSYKKLLVAGRCDRGGLMISRGSIERFRQERGFDDFLETSARLGTGCDTLREAIIKHIQWEDIPWTSSPRIFRLLKAEIIKLKDEGKVLMRMTELKQQIGIRLPKEKFSMEELRAVVGLLAGPGAVWQLEFGDFVLLQPERINSYAAAVIRSVRDHTEEIGCIFEEKVLAGELNYQDMERLEYEEEQIVLRAMHKTFVDHALCLREHADKGTLLIFPSYFKRERPEIEGHPFVLVTYKFNGALDEIYATLVVRLHHTNTFDKDRLWRFAADFKTQAGKRIGLKMTKKAEGAAELDLYFESGISDDVKVTFIRYVHEHLKLKANDVVRLRHYICPYCHTPVEDRKIIEKKLREGKKDIVCQNCERRVLLVDLIEEKFASDKLQERVRALEEQSKVAINNESRELILVGNVYAIAGDAGQIFRQYTNSDHGIDGEIEFNDDMGKASGKRLYLQLKSGDSYLYQRKGDGAEIFTIKKERHADYWQEQAYPVMLVIRTSDGTIRWMDISAYLKRKSRERKKVKQIIFTGKPFTVQNILQLRKKILALPSALDDEKGENT